MIRLRNFEFYKKYFGTLIELARIIMNKTTISMSHDITGTASGSDSGEGDGDVFERKLFLIFYSNEYFEFRISKKIKKYENNKSGYNSG